MARKLKIALWGYGYYGRDFDEALALNRSDECQVTALFDRRFESLREELREEARLFDPRYIEDLYHQGVFDVVAVSIFNQQQCEEQEAVLLGKGIPVATLNATDRFRSPETFPQCDAGLSLDQPGYRLFAYEGLHLMVSPRRKIPFVFDDAGLINRAYWRDYQLKQEPYARLFFPRVSEREVFLEGQWCILAKVYTKNYWHFHYEALDQVWILENSGYTGNYILNKTSFAPELLSLLGVDLGRVLWIEDLDSSLSYKIDRLICTCAARGSMKDAAPVLVEMAQHIVSQLPLTGNMYPERVFVKRIGSRKLLIDDKLLERYGFETIVPEELSALEQIRYFAHAKIVLSPHGANSTNSLYMQPGSVFVETFPNNYVNCCCLDTLALQDVRYIQVTETHYDSMRRIQENGEQRDPDYTINPVLFGLAMDTALHCSGDR